MNHYIGIDGDTRTYLVPRWEEQAEELQKLERTLASEPTSALPPSTQDAARAFLEMWRQTATKARVSAEVYADELRETTVEFVDLEAEITRRLKALEAGGR